MMTTTGVLSTNGDGALRPTLLGLRYEPRSRVRWTWHTPVRALPVDEGALDMYEVDTNALIFPERS